METSNYGITEIQWLPETKTAKTVIKKILRTLFLILAAVLVFTAVYFVSAYRWSQSTWSDLTIREIIINLTSNLEGTASVILKSHFYNCVLPALIAAIIFVVFMVLVRRKITASYFIKGAASALSIVVIVNVVASFWKSMNVSEYMETRSTYSSFIDENYVDPLSVDLVFPEKKRNLIYIYLESVENTFSDTASGGAFSENVIPELTELSLENENFSGNGKTLNGGVVMTGATWTMGAMFAQTSGLPLTISIDKNAMGSQDEFIPGATTLGDILAEEGYNQTLLLGSDASFGGRDLYFTSHGGYAMKDYYYYTENGTLPSDYYVWWGYEDLYLFENAKTELNELSSSNEPFNLTMLTVDTHFEDGYICSLCDDEFDDQYSNVYACSSRQVAQFVDWCKTQDWYDNTTIIISGDHLTMDSDYCDDVDDDYQRTVYTTVINGASETSNNGFRDYTTFDMFPTTLAALGVDIPGGRLSLGTNLYSSEETLLEIYGYKTLKDGLSAKSELIDNLTAGISDSMASVDVLEYNTDTKSIQIVVKDIVASGTGNIENVFASVWKEADQSDIMKYQGLDRGDGSYIFTISFEDFNLAAGTYNVTITANDAEATHLKEYTLAATTMDLSDPDSELSDDDAEYGFYVGDYDYSTGYFEITYSKVNYDDIVAVQFAVWKQEDQSDLNWYSAELGDDGVYRYSVNAFDYAFDDRSFTIDVYEFYIDGTSNLNRRLTYTIGAEE